MNLEQPTGVIYGRTIRDFLIWRKGSGKTIEVFDIAVNTFRRRGVGRKMMLSLLNLISSSEELADTGTVFAFTRESNKVAREFYTALGFSLAASFPNFYIDKPDDSEEERRAILFTLDFSIGLRQEIFRRLMK